jgi:exopolysaccharide biosynthesis polyprenyl glycosylphosphotransferase
MFKGGLDQATDGGAGGLANATLAGPPTFSSATALPSSSFRRAAAPARSAFRKRAGAVRVAPGETTSARTDGWLHHYQLLLIAIDLLAGIVAATVGFVTRFGAAHAPLYNPDLAFALALPLAWVGIVALNRAYEGRFIGDGATESERVFRAFLHISVLTGFAAYVAKQDVARGFIVIALPLALVLDLIGRRMARAALRRRRAHGRSMTPVLAVGDPESVARFASRLQKHGYAGMQVVGACVPSVDGSPWSASDNLSALGVPVFGEVDAINDAVRASGARSVAVLAGHIDAEKLRWISWQLEGTDTDLVVSPGLTEVGGRRLHIQPIAGLPLLHVSEPEFAGVRHLLKGGFDRVFAAVALLLLSPLLFGIALVVRRTSNGPALFCQTRIGKNGKPFKMVKFRSMYVGAEQQVAELTEDNEATNGLLFKIRDDPRVTRVGRVLRRRSLDELPQLINVLTGSMSLVGPRPPLPTEVAQYGDEMRRRLLVKPGLTGLWQISGRSDLSWEESVRLDLHYVENWSLVLDMAVLWKTARAVVRAEGAY